MNPSISRVRFVVVASALLLAPCGLRAAEKLKPEQLVQQHLQEALGPTDAITRARVVRGTAQLASRAIGQGQLSGSFELTSTALGQRLFLPFGTSLYEGETFAFDGKELVVGFGQRATGRRSAMGNFVAANDVILREGLLGGVLSAAWPLASLEARQPKVSYDGLKKLDGRELHRLSYRAKKGQNELAIHLYFEPESFRHVASVYSSSLAQSMGVTMESSSRQSDAYFRLEERFADFEKALGLTLPKSWTVRFEASSNTTTEWKYEMKAEAFENR